MIQRISDYLGITNKQLEDIGVFDSFVGLDTLLFLDPFLLKGTSIPEFKNSRNKIIDYFNKVLTLLSVSKQTDDRPWFEARKLLTFKETPGVYMGYGSKSIYGKGVGPELAKKLIFSAHEIIEMGIKEPEIFELLGLFEKDFGADRISDMTIRIIRKDFLDYTDRICKELGIKTVLYKGKEKSWNLPPSPLKHGPPIILLPREFLRDLPIAQTWEQIEYVVSMNEELRSRINSLIGENWSKRTKKSDIKTVLFNKPNYIQDLVKGYKSTERKLYDYDVDPASEIKWSEAALEFTKKFPLKITPPKILSQEEISRIVKEIIGQYKLLIEANGLNELLYIKKGKYGYKPRHERYSQKLFYAVADSYCKSNNIDLTREPNAGRGSVDFKYSQGYFHKVVVEIKLSSNNKLYSGFMTQLPIYQAAERSDEGIYLIIRNTDSLYQINKIRKEIGKAVRENKKVPECIVVESRIFPSASKAKTI